MNIIGFLESVMGVMDSYPLTSIIICLVIGIGMVAYKLFNIGQKDNKATNH